jgi:hypothetical protein
MWIPVLRQMCEFCNYPFKNSGLNIIKNLEEKRSVECNDRFCIYWAAWGVGGRRKMCCSVGFQSVPIVGCHRVQLEHVFNCSDTQRSTALVYVRILHPVKCCFFIFFNYFYSP